MKRTVPFALGDFKEDPMAQRAQHRRRRDAERQTSPERSVDASGAFGTEEDLRLEIAERAYARYLARGAGHGQDLDDWVEAEREVRHRLQ